MLFFFNLICLVKYLQVVTADELFCTLFTLICNLTVLDPTTTFLSGSIITMKIEKIPGKVCEIRIIIAFRWYSCSQCFSVSVEDSVMFNALWGGYCQKPTKKLLKYWE